jgi:hypothetical protein
MISRVILCAMMSGIGLNNLYPDTPKPLTAAQVQVKGKQRSISNVCKGKRKSQTVKDLCRRWEQQDG